MCDFVEQEQILFAYRSSARRCFRIDKFIRVLRASIAPRQTSHGPLWPDRQILHVVDRLCCGRGDFPERRQTSHGLLWHDDSRCFCDQQLVAQVHTNISPPGLSLHLFCQADQLRLALLVSGRLLHAGRIFARRSCAWARVRIAYMGYSRGDFTEGRC